MGKIIWFTGLSGSGKTTISNALIKHPFLKHKKTLVLDGDVVRSKFHTHLGFTPEDIKENNRLIAEICAKEKENYDFILVPIISPFAVSRRFARQRLGDEFIEVYVNCSLKYCIKRDIKGLYKRALGGEIENFIGVSENVPYEPPTNPEIIVNTYEEAPNKSVTEIISFLKECNY